MTTTTAPVPAQWTYSPDSDYGAFLDHLRDEGDTHADAYSDLMLNEFSSVATYLGHHEMATWIEMRLVKRFLDNAKDNL